MKDFVRRILEEDFGSILGMDAEALSNKSPLLRYLDMKTGSVYANTKTRRNLASIYAIYSILSLYCDDYFNKPEEYKEFEGYSFSKLLSLSREQYGGAKLQNHSFNSRVNGEFKNKIVPKDGNDLIINNHGNYALHIDYLYVEGMDISRTALRVIEEFVRLLEEKDRKYLDDIQALLSARSVSDKKERIRRMLEEQAEARLFEIIAYSVLKGHFANIKVYFGYSLDELHEQYLTLYKTGRTNANDGGIDFVLRPVGRFFQVTEVNDYNKYLLDMDKVMHFPITFVVKTLQSKEDVIAGLYGYIAKKSGGMRIIRDRYMSAVEDVITINELRLWLNVLSEETIDDISRDIDKYYRMELSLE